MHFFCFKPLVCGNLLWQTYETDIGPKEKGRDEGVSGSLITTQHAEGTRGKAEGGESSPYPFFTLQPSSV